MSGFAVYDRIAALAGESGLIIMGALDHEGKSLFLLGTGPAFWAVFKAAPEARDAGADPIDRWSLRVIGEMAAQIGAGSIFPFGGPPYAPFIRWALESGRAWQSPVGMLVHETVGMMISYRGALHLDRAVPLPPVSAANPCRSCETQPCVSACPVSALSDKHTYRLETCHGFLDTTAGESCMTAGCAVRRACPISDGSGREAAQSAHHMEAFHPR